MKHSLIVLLLFSTNAIGQAFELKGHINNKQVQFGVWHISPVVSDTILLVAPKDVIRVNMTDTLKEKIKTIKKEEWLKLLHEPEMDWTTNLILYELFKKEALKFRRVKTRDIWENTYKAEDIDYWEKIINNLNAGSPIPFK